MEYGIHRAFFHWEGTGPFTRKLHEIVHGYHHKYPDDDTRLVMPLEKVVFPHAGRYWFRLTAAGEQHRTCSIFVGQDDSA